MLNVECLWESRRCHSNRREWHPPFDFTNWEPCTWLGVVLVASTCVPASCDHAFPSDFAIKIKSHEWTMSLYTFSQFKCLSCDTFFYWEGIFCYTGIFNPLHENIPSGSWSKTVKYIRDSFIDSSTVCFSIICLLLCGRNLGTQYIDSLIWLFHISVPT